MMCSMIISCPQSEWTSRLELLMSMERPSSYKFGILPARSLSAALLGPIIVALSVHFSSMTSQGGRRSRTWYAGWKRCLSTHIKGWPSSSSATRKTWSQIDKSRTKKASTLLSVTSSYSSRHLPRQVRMSTMPSSMQQKPSLRMFSEVTSMT